MLFQRPLFTAPLLTDAVNRPSASQVQMMVSEALIGIASAPDSPAGAFRSPPEDSECLARNGFLTRATRYGAKPCRHSRTLLDEGEAGCLPDA